MAEVGRVLCSPAMLNTTFPLYPANILAVLPCWFWVPFAFSVMCVHLSVPLVDAVRRGCCMRVRVCAGIWWRVAVGVGCERTLSKAHK